MWNYTKIKSSIVVSLLAIAGFTLNSNAVFAEGETFTGKVIDQSGKPVQGASLDLGSELSIAVTNADGTFTIANVEKGKEITVRAVGYSTTSVEINNKESVVVIQDISNPYRTEMAMPFTTIKKQNNVSSTSTVSGEELRKYPITVLQNAFTAELTGVETYEATSEPGWSETDLYIRGLRTMNSAARTPLIIVDNMERDLSFLDAYPIESITVLKDAAATAIYGMRGANGAILVTTKRGEKGKTKIDVTQEFGFQTVSGLPESQNSYNYAMTLNQARYLDGMSPAYTDEDIEYYRQAADGTLPESLKYRYINTNWADETLRDAAPQYRTNLNISGGGESINYFVSFSYLKQEGLYDTKWTEWNDGYSTQHNLNRYNLRSNIDMQVNRILNVSLDLGGRMDFIQQPLHDVFGIFCFGIAENLPTNPVFTPNGHWYAPSSNVYKNSAALIAETGVNNNRRRNLYSNATASLDLGDLTEGLSAKATIGFDSYNTFQYTQSQNYDAFSYDFDSGVYTDPDSYTYTRTSTAQSLSDATTYPRDNSYNINFIGSIDYARTFQEKHSVNASVMMRSFTNQVGTENSNDSQSAESSNRYLTYAFQGNYVYDNRYILNLVATYQGNDNFAKGSRWGFFPSVSAGWVISNEHFMKNTQWDILKLRASYGRAGMSTIGAGRYPYQTSFSTGSGYNFGTSQSYLEGVYESATGNSNIQWEISDMLNIGADFDWKNSMVYGAVDVFKEWRSNILVTPSTVPDLYGGSIPYDSKGTAETKGFELTLGHKNNIRDFRYSVEASLTWNTNKVTYNDETTPAEPYQTRVGKRIDHRQILIKDQWASDKSLIPSSLEEAVANPNMYPYVAGTKLGNAVYVDQNGDRQITTDDQVAWGYGGAIPELTPRLKLGFQFKGFDAGAVLVAYLNRTVETRENMDYGFGWGGTSTHEVTKTWGYYTDDPNDSRNINALYPRLSTSFSDVDRNYPFNSSTVWIRNGNFLSLRNVEIGYSLPEKWIAKMKMTKCRFYFTGYNLATWSHFDNGFDPENPTNYVWTYPKTKTFSFGVNVGF